MSKDCNGNKKGKIPTGKRSSFLNQPHGEKQEVISETGNKTIRRIGGQLFVAYSLGCVLLNPLREEEILSSEIGMGSTLGKPKRDSTPANSEDRSRGDFQ